MVKNLVTEHQRLPLTRRGPELPIVVQDGPYQPRLDRSAKSAPVVLTDFNEPEWLQSAGDRSQHFCAAEHLANPR